MMGEQWGAGHRRTCADAQAGRRLVRRALHGSSWLPTLHKTGWRTTDPDAIKAAYQIEAIARGRTTRAADRPSSSQI